MFVILDQNYQDSLVAAGTTSGKAPTIDNDAHSYWIPIELGPESTSPFLTVLYV